MVLLRSNVVRALKREIRIALCEWTIRFRLVVRMENKLDRITSIKFKSDVVVDNNHCPNFDNKTQAQSQSVAFTVHIPFEQLKCWYDSKRSTLVDCSYVQILNAVLDKRYSLNIRENCSRLEECLV